MTTKFRLRFEEGEIAGLASRFTDDDGPLERIASAVKTRGCLSKEEFLTVCRWKTVRSQSRCRKNSEEYIREATRCALTTPDEQLRIEVLTLLDGVSWPTASVILHFFHTEPYPILDFRALWSLRCKVPGQYDFPFWHAYTQFCRTLASRAGQPMRTIDRALWQYSKENQQS